MNNEKLFEEFYRIWLQINAGYERYARKAGLSYTQLQILNELYSSSPGLTQKNICENCHLPKTTVNAVIAGWQKEHYVELQPQPEDKRQKVICLTAAGLDYAAPLMTRLRQCELEAFSQLEERTVKAMLQGLADYQQHFNDKLNELFGGK
ncbi:MAG: winged helix-turn-helix transcriptional regulator [Succinivibrio sp.]|nr:winged helix-turn-helix transcriptional regulator [Succinivibrio sp.]